MNYKKKKLYYIYILIYILILFYIYIYILITINRSLSSIKKFIHSCHIFTVSYFETGNNDMVPRVNFNAWK